MASNYMTSDGVDLDSRYLGINAKAKSAATADTATTATKANSVAWSGVSGKPGLKIESAAGALVKVAKDALPWEAPVDCQLISITTQVSGGTKTYVNGNEISGFKTVGGDDEDTLYPHVYLRKGDSVTCNRATYHYGITYAPYKIS